MPTYEYQCDKCGHRFEKFQSMTAAPIRKCPSCGKNAVRRLISGGAGLIFKGSGFYITDYRDSSYTDKAKAESGAAKPAEGAASGGEKSSGEKSTGDSKPAAAETKAKAEPKPAAKTESKPATKSKAKE
jgi:putative FmdB family regulatory protein